MDYKNGDKVVFISSYAAPIDPTPNLKEVLDVDDMLKATIPDSTILET